MMIANPPLIGAVSRRLGSLARRLMISSTVLTPAALLLSAPALADDYVWVGGSGAAYTTPANWNLNTAFPGNLAADTATFGDTANASETVTLAGPAALTAWTFNTTAATSFTVDGGQTVTLSGDILNTSTGGSHTIANNDRRRQAASFRTAPARPWFCPAPTPTPARPRFPPARWKSAPTTCSAVRRR